VQRVHEANTSLSVDQAQEEEHRVPGGHWKNTLTVFEISGGRVWVPGGHKKSSGGTKGRAPLKLKKFQAQER
jgi:hypothetical protein